MKYYLCLLYTFISISLFAQPSAFRDSLMQELETEKDPETRIGLKLELARTYQMGDTSFRIANEILEESKAIGYLKGEAFAREIRSYCYFNMDSLEQSLVEDSLHLLIQFELGDTVTAAAIYNVMGSTYSTLNKTDIAIEYLLKAAETFELIKDYDWLAIVYNNLGELLDHNDQDEEALFYLRKSLKLRHQYKHESTWHYTHTNLGHVFQSMEQYDSSVYHYQKSVEIAKKYDDSETEAISFNNLGNTYIRMKRYDDAIKSLKLATPYFEETGRRIYLAPHYNLLSETYEKLGQYDKAIEFGKKGLAQTEETGPINLTFSSHQVLANAYAGMKDYERALFHLRQEYKLDDSLETLQNKETAAELEKKYQTQQQKAQIAEQNLEIERQSRIRNYVILGAISAMLLLFLLFQTIRNRQKIKAQEVEASLQLKQAEAKQLREIDQLKSTFFANVSHEFRTPLTLILGPVQQALESIPASETASEADEIPVKGRYLSIIQRSALRLQNLVDQLLDLSKIDSGKMQLYLQQGQLIQLIRAIVFSFESLAERQQIRMHTAFPEELPDAWFDADKWEKILVNLLSNAFKYTPAGGAISIGVAVEASQLALRISDTGPGMAQEDIEKVFDRFYQIEGTELRGTGIGLSLVKELVDLHNGQIEIESTKGQGTAFWVRLPYLLESLPAGAIAEKVAIEAQKKSLPIAAIEADSTLEETSQLIDTGSSALPRLLIVEDNPDLRTYIAESLQEEFQISTSENGRAGVEAAIQQTPDLIISDVMMPEMDGFELCETLKQDERTSHIPIILLTAKAGQAHKLEGLEIGADDYLTKPFDKKELLIRAHNLIAQRRQLREKFEGNLQLRPSDIAVTSTDERFLQKVSEAIEANLDNEQFSVEDLAGAVAFSRSQLHRKLKSLSGKSPTALIRDFRMTRAKALLEQGAGNVSEVALEVGYSSPSYFTQCFKQAFGVLPSDV